MNMGQVVFHIVQKRVKGIWLYVSQALQKKWSECRKASYTDLSSGSVYGHNTKKGQKISDEKFRAEFFSDEMREEEEELPAYCRRYLKQVENEAVYFPVPESTLDAALGTS